LSEDREVYEIIASMPIDYSRVSLLRDVTFEAKLLLYSKFIKRITVRLEDFKKLHEVAGDKSVLLTTEVNGKRFLIYIEKGRIVSSLLNDVEKGERLSGLKPLAMLIALSRVQPITFKVFEVVEVTEDRTLEAPERPALQLGSRRPEPKAEISPTPIAVESRAEAGVEGKPVIVEFSKKLAEFTNKAQEVASDLASLYNCQVVDVKVSVAKGFVNVVVSVKKRGFFGKCDENSFAESLKRDLELLMAMHDINLPLKLSITPQR